MIKAVTLVILAASVVLAAAADYKCRPEGERCIGAPGKPLVEYYDCCEGLECTGKDMSEGGYGLVCAPIGMAQEMEPEMNRKKNSFQPMTASMTRASFEKSDYVIDLKDSIQVAAEGRLLELGELQSFPILAIPDTDMAIARFTFDNGVMNPTHVHPRATEMLYNVKGRIQTNLIGELGNGPVETVLETGQATFFPKGVAHSQTCLSEDGCVFVSILNGADPGAYGVALP